MPTTALSIIVPEFITELFDRFTTDGHLVEKFDDHGSRGWVSPTEALAEVIKQAENGATKFSLQLRPGSDYRKVYLDVESDLVLRISEDGHDEPCTLCAVCHRPANERDDHMVDGEVMHGDCIPVEP